MTTNTRHSPLVSAARFRSFIFGARVAFTTSMETVEQAVRVILAKVETDADLTCAVFTAHAVYSDMAVTGSFTCGSEAVKRLVQNSIWSQKGNFCDIPTDCPTRERAGWTVYLEKWISLPPH